MSTAAVIHGLLAMAQGVGLLLRPKETLALMTQIALAVGVSVPNIDPDSAALAMVGALAIAYGTSHVHIGRTGGRDANINMVCSESVLAIASLWLGYSRGDSFFLFQAAVPLLFAVICMMNIAPKNKSKGH